MTPAVPRPLPRHTPRTMTQNSPRWTLTLTATGVHLDTPVTAGPAVLSILADELCSAAETLSRRAVACASRSSATIIDGERLREGSPTGYLAKVEGNGPNRVRVVYGTEADGVETPALLLSLAAALQRSAVLTTRSMIQAA